MTVVAEYRWVANYPRSLSSRKQRLEDTRTPGESVKGPQLTRLIINSIVFRGYDINERHKTVRLNVEPNRIDMKMI